MPSNSGSIDEIISKQGFDDVEQITQKMNTLYVAFKQNVTAINLMNDALSKATSVKDVTGGIDSITTKTKKANQVVTEFIETQTHLDKAVTLTGDALNDQERAYAKLTATMGNGNKAAKLVTDEVKKQTKDTNDLKTAYQRLNDEYKASLIHSRNLAVQYGVTSKEFKAAATQTNLMGAELKTIDAQLGIHAKNVGNYAEGVKNGTSGIATNVGKIWSGLRTVANILPGFGLAGMFAVAGEAIIDVVSKIEIFKTTLSETQKVSQALQDAWGSSEVTTAITTVNQLSETFKLAKAGIISKTEALNLYNKGLGDVLGTETSWDAAEKKLIGDTPKYIDMMVKKTAANMMYAEQAKLLIEQEKNKLSTSSKMDDIGVGGNLHGMAKLKDMFTTWSGIRQMMSPMNLQTDADRLSNDLKTENGKLAKESDDAGKIADNLTAQYEKIAAAIGAHLVKPPTGGKDPKEKEVNRIDDLKKEYEARKVAEQQKQADMPEGLRSEVEYRHNLLKATEEYVTKMHALGDKLSTNEKSSRTSFHKEMLDDTESNTKNLEKIQSDKLKKDDEYYKLQSESATRNLTEQQRIAKLHADDEKKRDEEEAKHNSATIINTVKTEKEIADIKQARYNMEVALLRSSFDIANSISDAIYAKELQQIEDKANALEKSHENEIRFIEESGMTSIQQTKAKKKADAEYEAEKKKIDKDRKKALYNQALLNKALTMSEVVLATTLAVMNALSNKATVLQSVRFANAIAAGAIGTAQFIRAAAVKLPEYAKGRGKGKDEMAIVGEAGTEAIIRGDGSVEITPNRATTTFLKADDQVISNTDLIRSIQNSAYKSLSNKGTFTTDKLQNALINEFEKNTNEIKDLKKVLINKNLSVNTTNYGGFDSYLNSHIR